MESGPVTTAASVKLEMPPAAGCSMKSKEMDQYHGRSTSRKPTKRAKTVRDGKSSLVKPKKPRGLRGRLQNLTELPLDVVLEMFGDLEPLDILRLARSTKDLRRMLMSKSSTSVWKRARANLEMPDPPDDMSEPAFANLAFSRQCHHCLKPHVMQTIFWETRTKSCKSCFNELYVDIRSVNPLSLSKVIKWIPSVSLTDDGSHGVTSNDRHWLKASFEQFRRDCTDQKEWLDARLHEVQKINAHADLCRKWYEKYTDRRYEQESQLKRERRNAIIARLREIGWGDEIDAQTKYEGLEFLDDHRLVNQTRKLTDRIWTNIEYELVEELKVQRHRRVQYQELQRLGQRYTGVADIIKSYLQTLPDDSVRPSIDEICCHGQFKDLLLDEGLRAKDITQELLQDAILNLPEFFHQWRVAKDEEAFRRLRGQDIDASASDLPLAKSAFVCRRCRSCLSYPRVTVHRCPKEAERLWGGPVVLERLHLLGAEIHSMDIVPAHRDVMSELIRACGRNPSTATTEELDSANPFVKYRYIIEENWWDADRNPKPVVQRWTVAREQCFRRPMVAGFVSAEAPTNDDVALAEEREKALFRDQTADIIFSKQLARARCRHCGERGAPREHMQVHGISDCSTVDWIFHVDEPYYGTLDYKQVRAR